MPSKSEFEKGFHDVAEGRDPDEDVFVGGEWLPAIRVVREMRTNTSIMPRASCDHLGLDMGSTYGEGANAVLAGWQLDGVVGGAPPHG